MQLSPLPFERAFFCPKFMQGVSILDLDQNVVVVQKSAAAVTYTVSGGLVVGDWFQFLNEYAGAVGALIAVATFVVTLCSFGVRWYYMHRGLHEKQSEE